jgi:hypothetical protein
MVTNPVVHVATQAAVELAQATQTPDTNPYPVLQLLTGALHTEVPGKQGIHTAPNNTY